MRFGAGHGANVVIWDGTQVILGVAQQLAISLDARIPTDHLQVEHDPARLHRFDASRALCVVVRDHP